ncbi:MAG: hypothetical protein Q4C83_00875 [Candidatus Saccharibacteria bacterium]|nr:hypothetical protein [Candidatus Saccharibacteria bacterium]
MRKIAGIIAGASALAMVTVPAMPAIVSAVTEGDQGTNKETQSNVSEVKDLSGFMAALDDKSVTTIKLMNDINTETKINVFRDVTIDGNGHAMIQKHVDGWNSGYVLHIYGKGTTESPAPKVTIKNIKLTGGDAGLHVNGANVTLQGTIDLSGNEYRGMEISQGAEVVSLPVVNFDGATIINTTEGKDTPTFLMETGKIEDFVVKYNGVQAAVNLSNAGGNHIQLYLVAANEPTGEGYTKLDPVKYGSVSKPIEDNEEESNNETTKGEENPDTFDGVALYALLGLVGVVGIAATSAKALADSRR